MEQTGQRDEVTDRLVDDMRHSRPRHSALAPPWWDHPYDALRGRTPTQALRDGDEHLVRDLIQRWYEAADRSTLRIGAAAGPRVRIDAPRARRIA